MAVNLTTTRNVPMFGNARPLGLFEHLPSGHAFASSAPLRCKRSCSRRGTRAQHVPIFSTKSLPVIRASSSGLRGCVGHSWAHHPRAVHANSTGSGIGSQPSCSSADRASGLRGRVSHAWAHLPRAVHANSAGSGIGTQASCSSADRTSGMRGRVGHSWAHHPRAALPNSNGSGVCSQPSCSTAGRI